MKTILVTGSNGQLGSEIKALKDLYPGFQFLFHDVDTLNITDYMELQNFFQLVQPHFLINCAAYTAVDKAESESEKAYLINATAIKYLSDLSKQFNYKIIHVSTDYVFDGTSSMPYKEDDKTNPQSVYGKSKLEGEQYLYGNSNAIIIRTSWLYSIYGNNFVKNMRRYAAEKPELRVVFDQIGCPTNAADLAEAILTIINEVSIGANSFESGVYHYSNEGVCSWYDFTKEIVHQSGSTCKVYPIETKDYPLPARRPEYSVFNKAKIKETYKIEIPWWKDSLHKCILSLNKNI
jgi:dTDP-4-dehydrorhamnose reductase